MKIITLAYIYQLAKFGDFMSCGSKNILYKTHNDRKWKTM